MQHSTPELRMSYDACPTLALILTCAWFGRSRPIAHHTAQPQHTAGGTRFVYLCVVGQVLVQVGQAVGVLGQPIVHHPQLVARRNLPAQVERVVGQQGDSFLGWGLRQSGHWCCSGSEPAASLAHSMHVPPFPCAQHACLKRSRSTTYSAEMWYGLPCRWSFQKPCREGRGEGRGREGQQEGEALRQANRRRKAALRQLASHPAIHETPHTQRKLLHWRHAADNSYNFRTCFQKRKPSMSRLLSQKGV